MSAVVPANNTYARIETLVRRLTASASEEALKTAEIQTQTNTFYSADFPYAIKLDQMRSVYTFYTRPNIDRYPLDVNYNQGVRSPVYVDGIEGYFSKERDEFFRIWPKWPTFFNNQFGATSLFGGITNVTQANPAVVTSVNHGLATGQTIYIYNVEGMTELNNNFFTVTVLTSSTFSIGVDSTAFLAYIGGGSWSVTPVNFSLLITGPFLSREVTIGGTDILGNPFVINDDGNGILQLLVPNPVVSVPPQNTNPAVPGMYNLNTLNPGLNNPTDVGTVNYVSGQIAFTLPLPLAVGPHLMSTYPNTRRGDPIVYYFGITNFIFDQFQDLPTKSL